MTGILVNEEECARQVKNAQEVEFECTLSNVLYHKDDFKICSVFVDRKKYPKIKLGRYHSVARILGDNVCDMNKNTLYKVKATPEESVKYGTSYRVISMSSKRPQSLEDIERFLKTILTNNQATQILEHYPNIIELIESGRDNEIDFSLLKGISQNSFTKIKDKIIDNFALVDICAIFYNLLSLNVMKKIYLQCRSIDKIEENMQKKPYAMLCSIDGIGFQRADDILMQIEEESNKQLQSGQKPRFLFHTSLRTSEDRCRACMDYYLAQNEQEGNTKMSVVDLKSKVIAHANAASAHFETLLRDNSVFYYDEIHQDIGRLSTYNVEQSLAKTIMEANHNPIIWNIDTSPYSKLGEFNLTSKQQLAQKLLCNNNIVIINGPAGSGKSSSVSSLINMLKDNFKTFRMACPSAKAAKVLQKYSGYNATTIHRMLGYTPGRGFAFNEKNKMQYDVIIIDECSMLDVWLAKNVLDAIDFSCTKLLLVGDSYQLPSVGAGNFFHDLIQTRECPIATLDEIFRYSEGGLIKVATDTRNGKKYLPRVMSYESPILGFGKSYAFCYKRQEGCIDYVVKMYKKLLETNDIEDTIVITAQNKGAYGAFVINSKIQNAINPNSSEFLQHTMSDGTVVKYQLNDIIMQTVNDYKSVVCDESGNVYYDDNGEERVTLIANGESGKIVRILEKSMVVKYDDFYILRNASNLDKMMLGYAITCHKSQGSGYKNVIVVTPPAHTYMLNSNLLYVAYTRAKERCFHVGDCNTVNTVIKKKQNFSRKTFLQQLIKSYREEYSYECSINKGN